MAADRGAAYAVRLVDWASASAPLAAVRRAVFVVEQRIPEAQEFDALDAPSIHALAEDAHGAPIGCGRLLPDGHIGRMAVLRQWRGRGVGAALLVRLIETARARGDARVVLNAQTQAMPFYARFGFAPIGAPFVEADIPHHAMARMLA
ncbi:MAG: GNAT family N-acetyltransferase [Burkholderiales bacterium]